MVSDPRAEIDDGLVLKAEIAALDHGAEAFGFLERALEALREGRACAFDAAFLDAGLEREAQGANRGLGAGAAGQGGLGRPGDKIEPLGCTGVANLCRQILVAVGVTNQGKPFRGEPGGRGAVDGRGLKHGGDTGGGALVGLAGCVEAGNVHEGDGDGLALALCEQRAADARQQAVGRQEIGGFRDGEGEGRAFIGDGAGHGGRQVGKLEQAQARAADVFRVAADQGLDRRGALIGPDRRQRVGERLLTGLADEIRQQGTAPRLRTGTAGTGARAERDVDASISVEFEQGVGCGEGHAEEAGLGVHVYRLPAGDEDRLHEEA